MLQQGTNNSKIEALSLPAYYMKTIKLFSNPSQCSSLLHQLSDNQRKETTIKLETVISQFMFR